MKSNYNKKPFIEVPITGSSHSFAGYNSIIEELRKKINLLNKTILVIDMYPGVRVNEIKTMLIDKLNPTATYFSDDVIFYDDNYVTKKIEDNLTNDRVFGKLCLNTYLDFIDNNKLQKVRKKIELLNGLIILYGSAASLIHKGDIYIYADLARWEIQQRYRSGEISNWKCDNFNDDPLIKYKRGYFFEWRIADRYKKENFKKFDYILDTNVKNMPKMITGKAFLLGLNETTKRPFRVVPFFDPGVWGGQWMKEICDLDSNLDNYAWCFDCVPEENSLLLQVSDVIVEIPSINAVFYNPIGLLGDKVHARFGTEFPIRFDFLDTMDGQNLSLQVHPLIEYAQEQFGIHYTQDESYYILDAKDDANVYIGINSNITKENFINDLIKAQNGEIEFNADRYVNKIPCKKHDHYLIPAGTVHCVGANTMVLEVSATPYIFTFKLWDWNRVGLDGKPRPIHLDHGKKVIQFNRNTEWTKDNLVNRIEVIKSESGNIEEKTGLHERQFIETRRNWFSKKIAHNTNGGVNVINLIEGAEAIVESPTNSFEPFVVHYAETFIVPAGVGEYTISPSGKSQGKTIATLKAFVRT